MIAWLTTLVNALGQLVGFAATQVATWVKTEALRLARAARALVVWVGAHVTARAALVVAMVAAFEVFAAALTSFALVPIASSVLSHLIPPGSSGDGIVWMLWDTGLSLRDAFSAFVLYVANYTLVWKLFATWLQTSCISLATYRASLRTAKAIRDASL